MTPKVERDAIYTAAALAMVPWADDADRDLFEWCACQQCPHPGFACPCSGRPWPSAPVRAAIEVALAMRGGGQPFGELVSQVERARGDHGVAP